MTKLFLMIIALACFTLHAQTLRIVSYNVWFDDNVERYNQIIHFLKKGDYDLITLQEVTPLFREQLIKGKVLTGYFVYVDDATKSYSNMTLSKIRPSAIGELDLISNMQRQALAVTVEGVTVVNVHLDSMMDDTRLRIKQLRQIMGTWPQQMMIIGDFNFDISSPESLEFKDTLTNYAAASKKKSYDIDKNGFAKSTAFADEPSRLLDQAWGKGVRAFAFKVRDDIPFSDHYPIEVSITLEDKTAKQ